MTSEARTHTWCAWAVCAHSELAGIPNDDFLQNSLKSLFRLSKQRYKICICSVNLGQLGSFRNYKGFSIIFPNILDVT